MHNSYIFMPIPLQPYRCYGHRLKICMGFLVLCNQTIKKGDINSLNLLVSKEMVKHNSNNDAFQCWKGLIYNAYKILKRSIQDLMYKLSHHLRKPTICIGENKDANQLRSNCEADFATRIVQCL